MMWNFNAVYSCKIKFVSFHRNEASVRRTARQCNISVVFSLDDSHNRHSYTKQKSIPSRGSVGQCCSSHKASRDWLATLLENNRTIPPILRTIAVATQLKQLQAYESCSFTTGSVHVSSGTLYSILESCRRFAKMVHYDIVLFEKGAK